MKKKLRVDVAIFAHNECDNIIPMANQISRQNLSNFDFQVSVLANGCTDNTVELARGAGLLVHELHLSGKSRTWNTFVHHLSRKDSDILIFVDADIEFISTDCIEKLAISLTLHPKLWVMNSQPIKDIVARPIGLSMVDKFIAASSGGLDDWRNSICGQLYAMPTKHARRFKLPIGLPVEDGFLRALVITDYFENISGDVSKIGSLSGASHIYKSERSIAALIRHQERIVVGSAINAMIFSLLVSLDRTSRSKALEKAASDDGWISAILSERLPAFPFGFIPLHFLVKRISRLFSTPKLLSSPRRILISAIGFFFDLVVYIRAQILMKRGVGSGFW